ncbi:MAG TPA: short-chain dehydrogenase [Verrucomicrobia bacterium]|nr:short-chain dehydrogenase [Verrucomicrobiota bacterium]
MLKEKFSLEGRTALVTGSARGIGRAIALGLAESGAHLIVHGSRESEPLEEALGLVRRFDPTATKIAADLGDPDAVERIFDPLPRTPDILVCNASVQFRRPWTAVSRDEALLQMQVNFHATLRMFQLCYPRMKAQGWGRLITVGSVQERRPHPEMTVYSASKSAQENLVRSIARQIAKDGITVNNLCPGVFATDRNREALANPAYNKQVLDAIPAHFAATAEDAAGAALLLASDAGRYITGTTLMVDGGLCLPG